MVDHQGMLTMRRTIRSAFQRHEKATGGETAMTATEAKSALQAAGNAMACAAAMLSVHRPVAAACSVRNRMESVECKSTEAARDAEPNSRSPCCPSGEDC